MCTTNIAMSIGATVNLQQRTSTVKNRNLIIFFVILIQAGIYGKYLEGLNVNLGDALLFLREYDSAASLMCTRVTMAQWNFATNITDTNHQKMIDEQALKLKFERASWRKAITFAWSRIPDPLARRELKMIATKGRYSLTDDKFNEIHRLISEMKEIYTKARVCPYKRIDVECNLTLDYDINKIMGNSKDYDELLYYWDAWHEAIGPKLKNKYLRYVQLANQAAKLNGFADAGDQMRELFEDEYFQQNIAEVMSAITPLYKNLFTYVRSKLNERYGNRIREDGPLPAHVLGNMWAQNWENLFELVQPFPASKKLDVTLDMMIHGITPLRMFQIAEEFFTSLGMKPMPPEFWKFSMFEKPIDREVKCTPSAWDFCNRIDYRIKQCTTVTMDALLSTHYEMARLQYYLQYRDHPLLFRSEALPGFDEAVSDAIGLSIFTPQHLHKIGLHNNLTDDYDSNINFLMLMALRKVAYAPFAYIVDQWRWHVFSDGVENMTAYWWELRMQYQGIVPPMPRSERNFDPAAKYHIPADNLYAKYFVSVVLQFQLYQSLCEISGHTGELHTCDLYRSREAGRLLSDVLSMGASKPWQDIVRKMTRGRTNRIDASAMLKYFEPLNAWLKRENEMQPVIGWITGRDNNERYLRYRTASCSSLGLISHNLIYQRSLKQRVNKNGIILAHYSDLKQSSQSDYQKPQAEQKISVFQKMKQMTKDYWHVLIPVHILTSIGWAAIFYTAVRNGVDVAQILEYMNFSEKYVNLVRNSSAGDWAITYALYKIFTPLRYTVTVGGTTIAIRQLSRLGYVKAPSFKLQSAEPIRSNKYATEQETKFKAECKTGRHTEPPKP
ncbi:angiotensin-converting enzyme-like isoform X3 [Ooceraea biroi]|uniref:angiotensin-converting enzyme-like isoform X3 n=1 Tax=Ooceraea biroi TaxID=2015173 RepID=UPI000F09841C|nr:angiotensin-converting enzyme-like isoform X3 [Ooceraea biroi]